MARGKKNTNQSSSLQEENTQLKEELEELRKEFAKLKMTTERDQPSTQDVQFLSDGYDDLSKSKDDISRRMNNFELRLNRLAKNIENLSKAIDDILAYSYQYNLKIVGVPQEKKIETARESTSLCLAIFEVMGADVSKWDIDIAHRVPLRNQGRDSQQQHNPIICKFTRRLARNDVLKHRKDTNLITKEALELYLPNNDKELKVSVYQHLTPRLQQLLNQCKIFQRSYNYKYYWTKEPKILLRKDDNSDVIKIENAFQLENLRKKESPSVNS